MPAVRATGPAEGCTRDGDVREFLIGRWLDLTRRVLPGLARQGWPVHLDHCFMRICLDAALGAPWHTVLRRPAIRHATTAQLHLAIAVAERIVADPSIVHTLNKASLAARRRVHMANETH